MTVKKFADHFLSSDVKVKIIKSSETIFDGNLESLYYYGSSMFNLIICMVGAEEDKVCLYVNNSNSFNLY